MSLPIFESPGVIPLSRLFAVLAIEFFVSPFLERRQKLRLYQWGHQWLLFRNPTGHRACPFCFLTGDNGRNLVFLPGIDWSCRVIFVFMTGFCHFVKLGSGLKFGNGDVFGSCGSTVHKSIICVSDLIWYVRVFDYVILFNLIRWFLEVVLVLEFFLNVHYSSKDFVDSVSRWIVARNLKLLVKFKTV